MIALALLASLASVGAPNVPLVTVYIRTFQQNGWSYECGGIADRLGSCTAERKLGAASVKIKIAGYTAHDDVKIEMTISGKCADFTVGVVIDRFTDLPDSYLRPSKTLFDASKAALTKCGALKRGRGFDGDFTKVLSTLVALNEGERLHLQAIEK